MNPPDPQILEDELFEYGERDYDVQQIYASLEIPGRKNMEPGQIIMESIVRGMIARGCPLTHVPTWMIPLDVMPPDRDPNVEYEDPTIIGWFN